MNHTSLKLFFDILGEFDPKDITKQLGLTPTNTWRNGDSVSKTLIKRKHDGWSLCLSEIAAFDLEPRLIELLDVMSKGNLAALEQFEPQITIQISCDFYVWDIRPAIVLTPETIHRVAALNAILNIDIICDVEGQAESQPL